MIIHASIGSKQVGSSKIAATTAGITTTTIVSITTTTIAGTITNRSSYPSCFQCLGSSYLSLHFG
jgi:hypothetical protein